MIAEIYETTEKLYNKVVLKYGFNHFGLSVSATIGFQFNKSLTPGVRYNKSMTRLFNYSAFDQPGNLPDGTMFENIRVLSLLARYNFSF
jgi:hypothetical protein